VVEEISEPKDPRSETNDPSNTDPDSAVADGSPAGVRVPPNLNALGSATESEEPKPNDPSNNGSGSAASSESSSSAPRDGLTSNAPVSPDLSTSGDRAGNLSIVKPRTTGPRTKKGKERSKGNALKHGILSEVVLLKFESQDQFRKLLRRLGQALRPVGVLEETLVEKLAATLWRYRRLLQAENGELTKKVEEAESDYDFPHSRDSRAHAIDSEYGSDSLIAIADKHGLIPWVANPDYLEVCLDKLQDVRKKADVFGLMEDSIPKLLRRVYGARYQGRPGEDLFDVFLRYKPRVQAQIERGTREGIEDQFDYYGSFLKQLDREIVRLERMRKYPVSRQFSDDPDAYSDRIYGRALQQLMVPSDSHADCLLRYEASLERAFDRTLAQLERLQRLRLGLPVTQRVELQATVSQG